MFTVVYGMISGRSQSGSCVIAGLTWINPVRHVEVVNTREARKLDYKSHNDQCLHEVWWQGDADFNCSPYMTQASAQHLAGGPVDSPGICALLLSSKNSELSSDRVSADVMIRARLSRRGSFNSADYKACADATSQLEQFSGVSWMSCLERLVDHPVQIKGPTLRLSKCNQELKGRWYCQH